VSDSRWRTTNRDHHVDAHEGDTVNIHGLEVEVVSDADAEACAFVVCADAELLMPFADNVFTTCSDCGRGIQHRPYAPKRPPKICMSCVMLRSRTQ
jgi:hypothetical protein